MGEKKVTFLVSSSPLQTLNNYEAMRASIGLFDHDTSIVWVDDGVFFTLESTDKTRTQPFIRLSKDMEINLYVNMEDFKNRGLDQSNIIENIYPIKKEEFIKLILKSDVVMTF